MLTPNDLNQCFINGQWQAAASQQTFSVVNPSHGAAIAQVPDCREEDALLAIEAAQQAFQRWRLTRATERAEPLKHWHRLILQHEDALAQLMTLESGKPITEALAEVRYAASFVDWFSGEATRILGDTVQPANLGQKIWLQKQAVGVCVAITPWNFPLAMITRKCAPALAAGCSVIVKPAEATPLCALALAKLAEQAGFPAGVFNVLTSKRGEQVGHTLTTHPLVKKISFTGSTSVGKTLLKQAANTVKRVSMELGGNAPFIVFDDADIPSAVQAAMASKFRNAGQTCICANRFLVHHRVKAQFTAELTKAVKQLNVGDGIASNTQIGPLITAEALNKVSRLVEDALAHGAVLECGGKAHSLGGNYYSPTVLTNVTPQMNIANEEIFGPVASIMEFSSDAQAIELANNTPYGLAAYVFTQNYQRIHQMADNLEFGMIGINETALSNAMAPFGGMKESGLGREGSHVGIDEYLELKYVCLGGL